MKWFVLILVSLCSCNNTPEIKKSKPDSISVQKLLKEKNTYNDTVTMPSTFDPYSDSGYFRGYIPEKIDNIFYEDSNQLNVFLSNLITRKDIQLLNDETLSHSVIISQKNKMRWDTLRGKKVFITSRYGFGKYEQQNITINGVTILNYKWNGSNTTQEETYDLDEHSFRHFKFKGKEFYYIQAGAFYCTGASMGNVCYHLIYEVKNKKLNVFETCRFNTILLGDVNGDDFLDFLDFDNSDFCTTVPWSDNVIIHLYSCNKKGDLILQKDVKSKPYFIEGRTGQGFTQDSFILKNYYWPVRFRK